jgi:hypothetical protein
VKILNEWLGEPSPAFTCRQCGAPACAVLTDMGPPMPDCVEVLPEDALRDMGLELSRSDVAAGTSELVCTAHALAAVLEFRHADMAIQIKRVEVPAT